MPSGASSSSDRCSPADVALACTTRSRPPAASPGSAKPAPRAAATAARPGSTSTSVTSTPGKRASRRATQQPTMPAPLVGDRIAVVGAGMVGCCVARLLARFPGVEVTLVDVDASRAEVAAALGARFARPEDAAGGRDLVVHTSATAAGLQLSLDLLVPVPAQLEHGALRGEQLERALQAGRGRARVHDEIAVAGGVLGTGEARAQRGRHAGP